MIINITVRVEHSYNCTLEVPEETRAILRRMCLDDYTLQFGGRGIGSKLETSLINPLRTCLFVTPPVVGSHVRVRVAERELRWVVTL